MDDGTQSRRGDYLRALFLLMGMSFYWLWSVSGMFSTAVWYGPTGSRWAYVVAANIVAFALVVAFGRKLAPLVERRPLVAASGIVTSCGIVCATLGLNLEQFAALTTPGAILTGLGSAPLILLWRESSEQLHSKSTQRAFVSASVILSTLLYLLFVSLPFVVALIICSAAPIASALLLQLSYEPVERAVDKQPETPPPDNLPDDADSPGSISESGERLTRRSLDIPWRLLLCCFTLAIAQGVAKTDFLPYDTQTAWPVAVSCAILIVIAASAADIWITRRRAGTRLAQLFLPGIVVAASTIALGSINSPIVMNTAVFASHFLFLVYLYSELDAQTARGMLPIQSVALGLCCMDFGFLLGMAVGSNASGAEPWVLAFALALASAIVLALRQAGPDEQERFPMRPCEDEKQDLAFGRAGAEQLADTTTARCRAAVARYRLSEREGEILSLLVRGKSAKSIAQETFISYNTVKTHMSHIYHKMGVHNREELFSIVEEALDASQAD